MQPRHRQTAPDPRAHAVARPSVARRPDLPRQATGKIASCAASPPGVARCPARVFTPGFRRAQALHRAPSRRFPGAPGLARVSRAPHPDWIAPDWPAAGRVRALITTRAGGVSSGDFASLNLGARVGDDPQRVARNRAILRACLPAEPAWMKQVHGTVVVDAAKATPDTEADGAVARASGSVCAVLTADCLPVLLSDRAGKTVGIAHAGWRGLAAGIIESVVRAMDVSPQDLIAYIGPGIGPRNYEVGEDVRRAFVGKDPDAAAAFASRQNGKYLADLYALARQRPEAAGVAEVHGGGLCTAGDERLFSFRRVGNTGRMASLVWTEES